MNARKKGCAPISPRGSGGLDEPLLAADGTCAIYLGDRIVTDPESLASTSAKQQPARKQQPNRALCAPLFGSVFAPDDMVVHIIAKGASSSPAPGGKLVQQPASPDIQRDTLPHVRDQAPVASPSAAPPAPSASKSFSYSQQHPMQDPFAATSGGSGSGPQLRSFSSMQGRVGFGSGGGAPPAAQSCGGAAPAGAVCGPHGSGAQLHSWASTEWWRNMSSSRLNEMADAEDPRSPEMRKIPYVGGAAPMCAMCHGDGNDEHEQQQVAAVLQQQL
ncbi:hypothetical protein HXX76_001422 [Chlamydomonas incerta]|uniref:Uncharacterized protein n=1 Tax=Chlamydomonas incerta TaxID=51695 RepID=A0A835WC42_CHLIN|nr:hypothetical protein HXX76_001422 [Chlamydomonas incerta]|eukprot:KAG2444678.1 hypothetical protein HXX76_001422 [Chlamydomonas incerta]